MRQDIFVTGTDTGIGKTWISCGLLDAFNVKGLNTLAMKPVASGCELRDGKRVNEDAELLMQHASVSIPYSDVNPYAFNDPVAPHLAAQQENTPICLDAIKNLYLKNREKSDVIVMEGVGGWLVPISESKTVSDIVRECNLATVLVVGIRLGCINHALLTVDSLRNSGAHLKGWVANLIDQHCNNVEGNIQTLKDRIDAPLMGSVPFLKNKNVQTIADHLDANALLKL
ncbi:MAG: dethiobiotin synthase [Gammaproteobacteria bacterium]